jgi:glucose/arabinose dehydrogenase
MCRCRRSAVAGASAALTVLLALGSVGCFRMLPSAGGGDARFVPPRAVNAADVAVPAGFVVEAVATGLTFPSGVTFDDAGRVYVTETGYSYGEVWTTPRVLRIDRGGATTIVATGDRGAPWNGLTFAEGALFVAAGGARDPGAILRIGLDGTITTVVDGLPSRGDHHTNGPIVGRDGWLYFGQGTVTNSGVVGADNLEFGWLMRAPQLHDVPCADVTLRGRNFTTRDLLATHGGGTMLTGAFSPFGRPTRAGEVIRGAVPCNGAVLRVRPRGGPLELVAWGFRNPFALAMAPDGRLFATDNGYDDRGSRPVHGAADLLWAVEPGRWYGWPDFSGARPLDDGDHFVPPGKTAPQPLLASNPGTPPSPAAAFGVHASADGFDFSRSADFGWPGQAFVAEFGDQAPTVGKVTAPVGFKVVRVDPTTGVVADFAVNRGSTNGPASRGKSSGLERPIAARFDPSGTALYVVDFGVLTMSRHGSSPREGTGVLWRIRRAGASS